MKNSNSQNQNIKTTGIEDIKKEIIIFFSIVCNGIREEYENGASNRDLKKDIENLGSLINNLIDELKNENFKNELTKLIKSIIADLNKKNFYLLNCNCNCYCCCSEQNTLIEEIIFNIETKYL
jgi:hypothetical protein